MKARIAVTLALFAASALAQDEYAPGVKKAHPAGAARPAPAASRPAAAPAGTARVGVAALPHPPHPKDLDPAPGHVSPAGPIPAPAHSDPVALVGGTVHTVSGATLPGATLLLRDGKVAALGTGVEVPAGARRVDVSGRHVYPSLIAADSVLGLTEIGAVRASVDITEVGDINPNARAEVAVNPDSELLPVTRSNGVLIAMTAPKGGLLSGSGAVLELDGWTWEQMTLKAPAALLVHWPEMGIDRTPFARTPADDQQRARDERIRRLKEAFATARAYARGRDAAGSGLPAKDRDVKWDAMIRAARREVPVVVQANSILEIEAALRFAEEENLRLVLEGGQDSWRVATQLKQRGVPVLVGNVMDVGRSWEPYDVNFTTPLKLHQAGVEFAIISGTGGQESWNARNLPYIAAKAVSYGLPADEALKAITLYPARILGLGDRLGSIEVGKDASVIVTDGDPLEITSNVQMAFLRGRELDLTDRHKRLYERYRLKPRREP